MTGARLAACGSGLVVAAGCAALLSAAQSPKTHRLEATPDTVAYGYYWSEAKPVLRIASGDIIDVDTLLTNTPQGLARAGVPDEKIQASLKAVVAAFPPGSEGRGPGGHILTGPVYVEGAEPGHVLQVDVLEIYWPTSDTTQVFRDVPAGGTVLAVEFAEGLERP